MTKERVLSYDIFRGILLIAMVLFHIVVNLTPLQFDQHFFYWVPMGFIMFLGVILEKFLKDKPAKKLTLGLKLLGIFLLLNAYNLITKDVSFLSFIGGDQSLLSFEILFPMSAVIFSTLAFDRWLKHWKIFLFFACLGLISLNYFDIYYYNLSFFLYGMIGYFLSAGVNLDHIPEKHHGLGFILLYLGVAILPFFLIPFLGLYDFIVFFQVLALYFISSLIFKSSRPLILLGKHSLVLYVGHIFLIKLISIVILYAS